jgi:hypothetical protein
MNEFAAFFAKSNYYLTKHEVILAVIFLRML